MNCYYCHQPFKEGIIYSRDYAVCSKQECKHKKDLEVAGLFGK